MQPHKFISITEYIETFPKETQTILKKLRKSLKEALPRAEETISYNIPCFKQNDKYVIYFAAFLKHISVYPIPTSNPLLKNNIEKYRAGKGTLKFPLDKPLPIPFIQKVAKALLKQNLARTKFKSTK